MAKCPTCLPQPRAVLASKQDVPYWIRKDTACSSEDQATVTSYFHRQTGNGTRADHQCHFLHWRQDLRQIVFSKENTVQRGSNEETHWSFPEINQNITLIKILFMQSAASISTGTGGISKSTAFGE